MNRRPDGRGDGRLRSHHDVDGGQQLSDQLLVERACAGDVDAFAMLFRRHGADVHAFAQRRARSVDLADDVVAAAFEKAWHGLDRLGVAAGDRFRPWVFRIAANELSSMMRSQSRRGIRDAVAMATGVLPARDTPGPDAFGAVDDALAAFDTVGDDASVLAALGRLPGRYQEIISLRHIAGLTAAETATSMRISRGNAAVLLHRAMGALRRELEEQ